MLLMMPLREVAVVRAAELEPPDEVPPPVARPAPAPAPAVRATPAPPPAAEAEVRPLGTGPRSAELAMKWDWTRRGD